MKSKKKSKCWNLKKTIITAIAVGPFLIVLCCGILAVICGINYFPILVFNRHSTWEGMIGAIAFGSAVLAFDFAIFITIWDV